jgi:hypothetical protein
MSDIDQTITKTTEEAFDRLMNLLKDENERKMYEGYYKAFKESPSEEVRLHNAYRIMRKFLSLTTFSRGGSR